MSQNKGKLRNIGKTDNITKDRKTITHNTVRKRQQS